MRNNYNGLTLNDYQEPNHKMGGGINNGDNINKHFNNDYDGRGGQYQNMNNNSNNNRGGGQGYKNNYRYNNQRDNFNSNFNNRNNNNY